MDNNILQKAAMTIQMAPTTFKTGSVGFRGQGKYTRNGYRYSYNKDCGKRFRTEKEAEIYRQRLLKDSRYKADIWKVERIEGHATFIV